MFGRCRSRVHTRVFVAALAAAIAATGAMATTASAKPATFSNPTSIDIPDTAPGSPYPSSINVSGVTGPVLKATATLRNFTHTCPDDIAVLLVGPSGANSILMGRVGGGECVGSVGSMDLNLTFDQAAASSLNEDDAAVSGTYRPSQEMTIPDPLSAPAPGGPYPVNLDVFNGTPANGTWKLFVEDQFSGDSGSISGGWSLTVNAPDNTMTTGKPKLNKKKGTAQVPVTVGDSGQVSLAGKGVATLASTQAAKSVAVGPGTTNLRVKPEGKTKRKLNSTGKAKVKVTITFTPTGGTPNAQTKKIKLKKQLG
jgi:subtilisin-like proprotein convertase family protein